MSLQLMNNNLPFKKRQPLCSAMLEQQNKTLILANRKKWVA